MVRGSFKAGLWEIVRAHWRTYVDARTGAPRLRDWTAFGLPPLASLAVCLGLGLELHAAAAAALLTVSGLLSVFLFGVVTQISSRAMDYADTSPAPGPGTSAHASSLVDLAANAGYSSLVCIAAAIAFAFASMSSHFLLKLSSAVGIALGVHLVMTISMVLRREFLLTEERLGRARTGADLDEFVTGSHR